MKVDKFTFERRSEYPGIPLAAAVGIDGIRQGRRVVLDVSETVDLDVI